VAESVVEPVPSIGVAIVFDRDIDAVTEADLRALVEDRTVENLTLEFKRQLNLSSDDDKREACKDVSALANTAGGRILYGLEEKQLANGARVAHGLQALSDRGVRDRLSNVLIAGIHPRPRFRIAEISAEDSGGYYLAVEVYPSYGGDLHMVTGYDEGRFYKRTDTGTYPMSEPEVREGYARIAASRVALETSFSKSYMDATSERSSARESVIVVPWYGTPHLVDPRESYGFKAWLRESAIKSSDIVTDLIEGNLKVYGRGFRAISSGGGHFLGVARSGVVHLASDVLPGDVQEMYSGVTLLHRLICVLEMSRYLLEAVGYFGPVRIFHVIRLPKPFELVAFSGVPVCEYGTIPYGTHEHVVYDFDFRQHGGKLNPAMQLLLDQVFNAGGLASCPWFGPDSEPTPELRTLVTRVPRSMIHEFLRL
jgi:Schlafen, AlbA_2